MHIQLNGEPKTITATNLCEALSELSFGDAKVATAMNGDFVPVGLRQTTVIQEGDRIEVLAPMQGG